MTDSAIEWTDKTWNPTRGCRRVSPGCQNCYAERVATRFSGPGQPYEGLVTVRSRHSQTGAATTGTRGTWNGKGRFVDGKLGEPLHWKKSAKVFVNSMSDLFFEEFSNEQIAAVFGVMATCPQHTFQVLTKRPERMVQWFEWIDDGHETADELCRGHADLALTTVYDMPKRGRLGLFNTPVGWPLPNVWLGVSAENQDALDDRYPYLANTPAAVRFFSLEPLLGPIDLTYAFADLACKTGKTWAIVGCESGPGARRCDPEWIRSIVQQCKDAEVPVFVKQARAGGGIEGRDGDYPKPHEVISLPYVDGKRYAEFPCSP